MEVEVRRVASSDVGFVSLPLHLIYMLQQSAASPTPPLLVLELKSVGVQEGTWFVAWAGNSSRSSCIEVPEILANCIGLNDGARVTVRVRIDVPEARSVHVEPATLEDSEILELNAGYLEDHILSKVGVVEEGCRFPVVVPGQGTVTLLATSTAPSSPVKLVRGTELVVTLKKQDIKEEPAVETPKPIWFRVQQCASSLHQPCQFEDRNVTVIPTTSVWICATTASRVGLQSGQLVLLLKDVRSVVPSKDSDKLRTTEQEQIKAPVERRCILRICFFDQVAEGHVMITEPLRRFAGVRVCSGVYLQPCQELRTWVPRRVKLLLAIPCATNSMGAIGGGKNVNQDESLKDRVPSFIKSWIQAEVNACSADASAGIFLAAESILSFVGSGNRRMDFILSLSTNEDSTVPAFCLKADSLEPASGVQVQLEGPQYTRLFSVDSTMELPFLESVWLKGMATDALSRLKVLMSPICRKKLREAEFPVPGGVVIRGPRACGKTQLALALAREVSEDRGILAHWLFLKCSELAGEAEVKRVMKESFLEAVELAPSLVILDDLDVLTPAVEGGSGSESSINALAEYLSDLIADVEAAAPVAFVATANGPLAASLCSSGHLDYTVELAPPGVNERFGILKGILISRGYECSNEVATTVAERCEGYDANDLEIVVDRALHAAASRLLACKSGKSAGLLGQDFETALQGYTPSALQGVAKGGDSSRLGWEDVGGLPEVCRVLQELLELPVKFPKLFSNAPLRLRTGVLLYGPPGCGKTHIVAAAAAACSLRFVPVKGPELLDKYIGASEKAVRDIFVKAAAAAPCILFFDEFDAIAPKRGHDNTGVTDRVVNQLLAELDGVSSLKGVFVFAATNRPDLIDAALLRPGRLDHLLFCNFPSARERLDIWRVLSRHLPMAKDIDFEYLAAHAEGFSGADIKAVLSDAELEAVHSAIETSATPLITTDMLKAALEKTIPLQEGERKRFASIYTSFTSSRASSKDLKGKKATLA